MLQML